MKERVFSFIAGSAAVAVELETALTGIPAISPDSGGEGELEKLLFLESWLRGQGIDRLERYDAPDSRARGGVRPNLVATIPGRSDDSRLWIISHLDVVPPGEASLWTGDPWTVTQQDRGDGRGLRLVGRGVEDNQQGLVSSVLAALSLTRQGIVPARTVKLLFAADEENGSRYGVDWLLKNVDGLFRGDDMALIPDGGDPLGETLEIAEKNLVWIRFNTIGAQAHGSRPDLGANAHLAGAELAVRLHGELSQKFSDHDSLFEPDCSTFEPTKKEANVPNINTIPGDDVFCMDMRILPRYPVAAVLAEVDRIKAEVEAKHRVTVSYTLPQRQESRPTPADAPVVKLLSEVVREVCGVDPRPVGIGGGTVGAYLRNAGIDSVVWSRMDDTAHQPDEYALLDNILDGARVMALLMLRDR